jgi:hypothetical protein
MRRTLTVLAATAALLTPAAVGLASAPVGQGPGTNASCNNGHGGNEQGDFNNRGNLDRVAACLTGSTPVKPKPIETDLVTVDPT